MKKKSTEQLDKGASVTRKARYVTVAPSPLNAVKLDLGIIIVLSVIVWVLISRLIEGEMMQFIALLVFGLIATSWIIVRTRRLMRAYLEKVQRNGET